MSDDSVALLKARRDAQAHLRAEALARLREAAMVALERRGYDVRGKTTTQIRETLRHHPTKPHTAA